MFAGRIGWMWKEQKVPEDGQELEKQEIRE